MVAKNASVNTKSVIFQSEKNERKQNISGRKSPKRQAVHVTLQSPCSGENVLAAVSERPLLETPDVIALLRYLYFENSFGLQTILNSN